MFHVDVNAAVAFAAAAHSGQTRKYTGAPYIIHPVEVMNIVRYATTVHTPVMLAAAVLHDTVEDTHVTLGQINEMFGPQVTTLVHDLTDQFKDAEHGNRSQRKAKERARLSRTTANAQTIKVADMIANTNDIVAFDPGFARVYLAEKRELLAVLLRADPKLRKVAEAALAAATRTIAERG